MENKSIDLILLTWFSNSIFCSMVNISIFVFHHGQWNHSNCYKNYNISGVLVSESMISFVDFVTLILRKVQLEAFISSFQLSNSTEFWNEWQSSCFSNKWRQRCHVVLALVNIDSERHPLVIHVFEEVSSSTRGCVIFSPSYKTRVTFIWHDVIHSCKPHLFSFT